jgi:hypothetical protein
MSLHTACIDPAKAKNPLCDIGLAGQADLKSMPFVDYE